MDTGAVTYIDDPHVVWAIICVVLALVATGFEYIRRIAEDEKHRKDGDRR